MTFDAVVMDALNVLQGDRHTLERAEVAAPRAAGLYAFYGDTQAWNDLGLTPALSDAALYVGKAEKSLHGRDVRTHFASGKTGSSTVRRSLAALLIDVLDLEPVPRNLAKPDGSANFALTSSSDDRLSSWMEARLRLALWPRPDGIVLGDIEAIVVLALAPPLNLDKVGQRRDRLRTARKEMADRARAWTAPT